MFGALGGSRTHNLLIRSQMLYPLSYERDAASLRPGARDTLLGSWNATNRVKLGKPLARGSRE
jgi:hypothetical protein